MILLFILAPVVNSVDVVNTRKVYDGYQVLRTFPDSKEKLELLKSIEESVETWTPVSGNVTSVDLMVGLL